MKKIFIILLCFFCFSVHASDAYNFTKDAISALGEINIVANNVDISSKKNKKENSMMVIFDSVMKNSTQMRNAASSGIASLSKYKDNKDENIKMSANTLISSFSIIESKQIRNIELSEKYMNNHEDLEKNMGTLNKELIDSNEDDVEIWRLYGLAVISITWASVDMNKTPNEKVCCLLITQTERDNIKKQMINLYGQNITLGAKKNNFKKRASAAIVYDFFNNKGWKSSDSAKLN